MKFSSIVVGLTLVVSLGGSPALAANATWNGTNSGVWSDTGNWSASPVPGTGDQALFNNAGNSNTTIDLGAGVTIRQLVFNASGVAAYTIGSGAVNSQSLTLDSTGNGTIQMNSTVQNDQLVNAQVRLPGNANYLFTNASTSNRLTVAGNVVANSGVAGNLLKTGAGLVILSGTNDWADTSLSGIFYVTGGGELRLTGGQNNFNRNTTGSRPRSYIGTDSAGGFSGNNTMTLSGGGRMVTAGITIGGGTYTAGNDYGNNALIISTPGTSGSKTWTNIGSQNSDLYDFGASVLGQNTDGNSIQISNGAYVDVPSGGKSFYIGSNRSTNLTDILPDGSGNFVNQGGNNNYVSVDGPNTIFNRQSNSVTYVGFNGNGNHVDITNGGRFNAVRLAVGANGDNNYVRVSGFNGSASILNSGGQDVLTVGGGNGTGSVVPNATPSGNYILIENGGQMTFTGNQNRDNNIGNVNGANNNYIKATGVGSSVQIREAQSLFIGGSNGGGDTTANGNYFAVEDGATGIVNSITLMGVNSQVKVGSGTVNIAQLEVRTTATPGIKNGIVLQNADARLVMNNGRLVAGASASMVNGPGAVDLQGTAYFSTSLSGTSIDSAIIGVGDLHKTGTNTLSLTSMLNTYSGDTYVDAGVLQLNDDFLDDLSSVYLYSTGSAKMNLNFAGADTIAALYLDDVLQAPGTYGRSGSAASNQLDAYFNNFPLNTFGFGILNIEAGDVESVPEPSALALAALGVIGLGLMTRRRKRQMLF